MVIDKGVVKSFFSKNGRLSDIIGIILVIKNIIFLKILNFR